MPEQFEAFEALKEAIPSEHETTKESLQELHDNLLEHIKSNEVTENSLEDKTKLIDKELEELIEAKNDLKRYVEPYKKELEENVLTPTRNALDKLEEEMNLDTEEELPEDAPRYEKAFHFFKDTSWKEKVATTFLGIASGFTLFGAKGEAIYATIKEKVNGRLGKETEESNEETETDMKEKIEKMSKDDLLEKLVKDHKENFKHEKSFDRLPLMDKGALRLMVLMLSEEKFKHLRITSTLRTKEENTNVRGKKDSKHLKGLGFDIGEADSQKQPTYTLEEAQTYINQQYVPGAIYTEIHGTDRHLHVGLTAGNERGPFDDAAQVDAALKKVAPIA